MARFKVSWWARQDLNLGPTDYESAALTAELRAPCLRSFLVHKRQVCSLLFKRVATNRGHRLALDPPLAVNILRLPGCRRPVFPANISELWEPLVAMSAAVQPLWSSSSGQGSLPHTQEGASNVYDLYRQAYHPADSRNPRSSAGKLGRSSRFRCPDCNARSKNTA